MRLLFVILGLLFLFADSLAQSYPSDFGNTVLFGQKNENRLDIDPVEQRIYSSFGAGVFWDLYPNDRVSFLTELEYTKRVGTVGLDQDISFVNLYYTQLGVSTKISHKKENIYKPYLIGGVYAMSLVFRDKSEVPEGYLNYAFEWRIGLGLSHIFFSKRLAFEATYRSAFITYKQGAIRSGMESVFFTLRYYWPRSFVRKITLQDDEEESKSSLMMNN